MHSVMFDRLKRLYQNEKRLSKENMKRAVVYGWITEDEYKEIVGENYSIK